MTERVKAVLQEISGSLGDLGTFLPLALGLIAVNGLDATTVFLSAGILYIAAAAWFRLPIPVQPLKATSAVAIATCAPAADIAAAGLIMGALFLGAACTGLGGRIARFFTRPVVRGIQLGLAVLLVRGGWKLVAGGPGFPAASGGLAVPASAFAGAVAAGLVMLSAGGRRFPSALAAVLFGIVFGLVAAGPGALEGMEAGVSVPLRATPAGVDFGRVIFVLLLPQIPLTFANSVVATTDACRRTFGDRAGRVSVTGLCASLGIANLLSGFAGGMPMCHGSGGVTAHHRFGARSWRAGLSIGLVFAALALCGGRTVSCVAALLPSSVLGVLLLFVGIEHAKLVRDVAGVPREIGVAAAMGLITLASGNLGIAFAAGMAMDRLLRRDGPRAADRARIVG